MLLEISHEIEKSELFGRSVSIDSHTRTVQNLEDELKCTVELMYFQTNNILSVQTDTFIGFSYKRTLLNNQQHSLK